jgi:hypothetical protein
MDPREFLGLAKDLLDATPNAVACRTAIGRSYYAALNVALSMLSELNIRLDRDEDSHKRLAQILDSSENPDLKRACVRLANQKNLRKLADYDMGNASVETSQKAGLVFQLAKQTIEELDRVHSDANEWKEASEKMLAYAKNILRKPI